MPNNVARALCYALGLVSGVLFLVLTPYNQDREIRFHAYQSIFLTIAWFVLITVVNAVLAAPGLYFFYVLSPLISLAGLAGWLFMMYSAYQGKRVVVPVVGDFAARQAEGTAR